ncbi:MAG: hypothetical protein JO101_05130 [Candidatus Eremiobacteraeota bacterium]|nr:hypothetical protein [Candidatus Eremiobacteraeota bacterium]MBV8354684.1 hypothetical protein [Candidatus Eremiobacteraeota bacterium]
MLSLAAGIGASGSAVAAVTSADRFVVQRVDQPFVLDGSLSDPRWAPALDARRLTSLASRGPARDGLRAAIFYDDTNLYVGFKVEQSEPITATQTTNTIGFGLDDFVGIGIDPVGNGERSYWFETTPRGTRYQQANESARFLPAWDAAGTTFSGGWSAILVIPLRVMHIPANGAQHWRMNIERFIAATADRETWAFNSLMGNYPITNFPDFRESRWWPTSNGIVLDHVVPKPQPRAEFFALDSSGADHAVYTSPSGATFQQNSRALGLDAAYPVTPTVNLDLALSPDFSNVEIDQQTITPQQFRLAFREYRPFFAQGANYINTELENYEFNFGQDAIFYSPSIGPFDRGLKLEGTQGTNSFGVLEAKGDDPTGPQNFDDIAFGFKHKRQDNTLAVWADGVMAHHFGLDDSTFEVGAYGRSLASGLVYSFDHASEFGTAVANPSKAQKTDALFDIQKSGPFEATLGWVDIGPQYNPIDGFTNIADVRGPDVQLDWVMTPKDSSWRKNAEIYLFADRWLDSQGQVHESDADAYLNVRTKKQVTFSIGDQIGSQRSYGGNYFSGYYNNYANAVTLPLHAPFAGITLGDGAPKSFNVTYQSGAFGPNYLQQLSTTTIYQFGRRASFEFDYAGTHERPFSIGAPDSQYLRRVTLGVPLGVDGNASFAYRVISGTGGFATPGKDLAFGLRKRFRNGSELFANYGTPAATSTLDRLILKYLVRIGGGV